MFTWPEYRRIVTEELVRQLVDTSRICPEPSVNYCLVAGKIATNSDREKLHQHFKINGWILYDKNWIKRGLEQLASKGYENDVAIIVAKLFSRI